MNNVKIIRSEVEPAKENLWLQQDVLKMFTPSGWSNIIDQSRNIQSSSIIYVAKNGNDLNSGSNDSPLLTVQAAINKATAGTTVYICPGTYNENLTLKAGVNLTSPIKFGVYIVGNHTASSGTIVIDNITLNSTAGVTLTVDGTALINLQLISAAIYSSTGDAIQWLNTYATSKLYIEDCSVSVATSGATARAFYSASTSNGSIIANRTTFKLDSAANICLSLNGGISFTHTSDQVYGQIIISDTASYVGQLVALTSLNAACLTTNSSGTSVLFACTLSTNVTAITGAGVFLFSALSYGSTGVGGASTLNGGVGAIALPISALAFRQAPLKASPQDGLLEYNGSDLYFTKGTTRYKVSLTAL